MWCTDNNPNGQWLNKWIESNSFTVMNILYAHLTPTHDHSVIDLLLSNDPSSIQSLKVNARSDLHSDHHPLSVSLADPITAQPPSSSNKWDTTNANWDRFAAVEKALLTAL